jgi:hypothetical protein
MSPRFYNVPPAALLGALDNIGAAVKQSGGGYLLCSSGNEIVALLRPARRRTEVRVFTSISTDAQLRDCGADAIRIFWGVIADTAPLPAPLAAGAYRRLDGFGFKPLCQAVRVFRTAPAGGEAQRQAAFLERLTGVIREAFKAATVGPRCPACGAPQVERTGRSGPFKGCSRYPACNGRAEAAAAPAREPNLGAAIARSIRSERAERYGRDLGRHLDSIAEKHHGFDALGKVYPPKGFL